MLVWSLSARILLTIRIETVSTERRKCENEFPNRSVVLGLDRGSTTTILLSKKTSCSRNARKTDNDEGVINIYTITMQSTIHVDESCPRIY